MKINLFKKFKKENLDINRIILDKRSIYNTMVKLSSKLVTETGLFKKEELEEQIKWFLIVMVDNFPTFPLERFMETFANLYINNHTLEKKTSFYRNDLNSKSINLLEKHSLFHEFLHFAADKNCKDKVMSGFEYSDGRIKKLGRGLDEGYTQLLATRYFPSPDVISVELYTVDVVCSLEEIIGREKMGDLYFNGNIFNIIDELTQLSSEEEAQLFIKDMDRLYDIYSKNGAFDQETKVMNELLNKLKLYLDECKMTKDNNKKTIL